MFHRQFISHEARTCSWASPANTSRPTNRETTVAAGLHGFQDMGVAAPGFLSATLEVLTVAATTQICCDVGTNLRGRRYYDFVPGMSEGFWGLDLSFSYIFPPFLCLFGSVHVGGL